MTKQEALATIAAIKEANKTYYFDGTIDIADMVDMFRRELSFGESETNLIIAALVAVGCVFFDQKDIRKDGDRA